MTWNLIKRILRKLLELLHPTLNRNNPIYVHMVNLPTPILTFLYVHPIIGSVALSSRSMKIPGTLFLPFFFHSLSHCMSVRSSPSTVVITPPHLIMDNCKGKYASVKLKLVSTMVNKIITLLESGYPVFAGVLLSNAASDQSVVEQQQNH